MAQDIWYPVFYNAQGNRVYRLVGRMTNGKLVTAESQGMVTFTYRKECRTCGEEDPSKCRCAPPLPAPEVMAEKIVAMQRKQGKRV